jgi:hypothetical protein
MSCHTRHGGPPCAGGYGVTPFGSFMGATSLNSQKRGRSVRGWNKREEL